MTKALPCVGGRRDDRNSPSIWLLRQNAWRASIASTENPAHDRCIPDLLLQEAGVRSIAVSEVRPCRAVRPVAGNDPVAGCRLRSPCAAGGGDDVKNRISLAASQRRISLAAPQGVTETGRERAAIDTGEITSFALLFHELATNSLKYGALAANEGRSSIRIFSGAQILRLLWAESAASIRPAAPRTAATDRRF